MDSRERRPDRRSYLKDMRRHFLYRPAPESRPDQTAEKRMGRLPGVILVSILAALSLAAILFCYFYIDTLSGYYLRNLAADTICIVVCLLIEISIVRGRSKNTARIFFALLVVVCGVYLYSDLLFWCVDGNPRLWGASYISNILYALSPLYLFLFFWLFLMTDRLKEESVTMNKVTKLVIYMTAALSVFIAGNYPAGYFFTVSKETGEYSRGSLYFLPTVCMVGVILVCLVGMVNQKISTESKLLLMFYPLIPLVSVLFGLWSSIGPGLDVLVTFCSVIFMYTNIYVRNGHLLLMRENALIQSQMNVLQHQVNPHFLFNTLGTIDSLCEEDPAKAQEVIRELSEYMSRNLRSFSEKQLVPFRDEMEQVALYLKIIQVRFPNIRIETDIRTEEFYIPPLTIQLLAENAILHGICKRRRSEGLLRITSSKIVNGFRVTVEDNGVGFTENIPDDGRKHIGIINVSKRLETLCSGRLIIRSIPGEGTVCIIRLPEDSGTGWRGDRSNETGDLEV